MSILDLWVLTAYAWVTSELGSSRPIPTPDTEFAGQTYAGRYHAYGWPETCAESQERNP